MLLQPLLHNAQSEPDKVSVIDDLGSYTNQRVMQTAFALGALLKAKTSKPTVGILLPSGAGFIASFYGTLLAGKVPVPINFLLGPREIGHIIADSGIDTILTLSLMGDRLKGLPAQLIDLMEFAKAPPTSVPSYSPPSYNAGDLATILYTSGTSGLPKGVVLTHGNMSSDVNSAIEHAHLQGDHTFLGLAPLFHSTGMLATMLAPVTLGAKVVFTARFSPVGTIKAIREHAISVMVGVPSMYGAMARLKDAGPDDFKTMFAAISGGEPLPSKVREAFHQKFNAHLYEGYGLTETIGPVCFNVPGKHRPGSVGQVIPHAGVRIVDEHDQPLPPDETGEVQMKGPMIFQGYHNLPDETAKAITPDGYFRSGDLGHIDNDGFVFITGRKKDLIIVSGEKVYPREIEELLSQDPTIADVAVIGRKDESRGEAVVAFIVPKEGQIVTLDTVRNFCRDKGVVNWKIPKDVIVAKELPRSPTGKVLKRELVAQLSA